MRELYNQLSLKLTAINQRLVSLGTEEVRVLPVKDQTDEEVPVTLEKIKKYLTNLNTRLKSCPEDQIELIKHGQENPELNPLLIAHSQIIKALQVMGGTLNASLKQTNSTFKVELTESPRSYTLELVVNNTLDSTDTITFDLLNENTNQVLISEKEKWKALGEKSIGEYSIDGLTRYDQIQAKYKEAGCTGKEFKQLSTTAPAGVPFVRYEDASFISMPHQEHQGSNTALDHYDSKNDSSCPTDFHGHSLRNHFVYTSTDDIEELFCDYNGTISKADCPYSPAKNYCWSTTKGRFYYPRRSLTQMTLSIDYQH